MSDRGGHNISGDARDVLDDTRDAYDRQPLETDKAWQAFVIFRNLGVERSLGAVAEKLGKEPVYVSNLERWSSVWKWRHRAAEWDRAVDARSRTARLGAAARATQEMIAVAESMWKLAGRDLIKWHRKLEEASNDPTAKPALSPSDLQKLVDTGMKLHRLSLGEPVVISDVNVGGQSARQEPLKIELVRPKDNGDDPTNP